MSATNRLEKAMVAALKQALATSQSVIVPPGGSLLWGWFMDLNAARTWHMNGPNPISYAEIVAYSDISLSAHHVAILRAMDAAYVEDFYSKRVTDKEAVAPRPTGDISPDLFDAVFG
ncbi:Hypothetical protein BROD_1804 [Brucella sp. NF 2653]|uniref:phage tail assembly chaperone n=1 Tax=unclassified Brucella TaxID=2632610 RepID=UPI0001B47C04|nr:MULTISPECIES: hypothetical protein [unclassified Brucella]EEZ32905.1 predicted protein [Brucella sp. 83/13]EFM62194.1 Hypothetical protein BROD_1804 [Brucella sp. NF 2653]